MLYRHIRRAMPRTWEYITEGLVNPSGTIATYLCRLVGHGRGSGAWHNYTGAELRYIVARRIVARNLGGMVGMGTFAGLSPEVDEQLFTQTAERMPDRIVLRSAYVELRVDVPIIVTIECNQLPEEEHGKDPQTADAVR